MTIKEILGYTEHGWFDLVADLGIEFAEKNTNNFTASRELCGNKHFWNYVLKRINVFSEKWMRENLGRNKTFKSKAQIVRKLFSNQLQQHFNKLRSSKEFRKAVKIERHEQVK